ncbi:hypothetical protein [Corallococcus exiguus]|uniref:hypothetical protein n=1 Tax=Corallococcus exiguus TaxID=83462 RepID=UPI0014711051|nr:hypothetical protein [Corallococcus exiguus]NNB85079.1 hypothetical protein [Corallococcus exiguus]
MPKIQTYSILSLGLLALSACQGGSAPDGELAVKDTAKVQQAVETPVSRVTAQPTWVGYLKVRSRSSGSWTTPTTANRQWKTSYSFVSPVVVTMIPASMFALVDIKPGFSSFDVVDDSTFQGTSILKHVAKCFRATPGNFAFMQFPSDGSYSFQPAPFNGSTCWGTGTQGGVTTPSNVGWHAYNTMSFANEFVFPVPAVDEPLRLHHTKHFITVNGAIVQSVPSPLPYGTMPVEWDFEWDLMPEDPDVDLVLSADGYENWLPKATISPGGVSLTSSTQIEPGSTLVVKAKAEPKDPSLPTVAMKQVTFLLESSNLPGIAMNRTPQDLVMNSDNADLSFEQDRNAAYGLNFVDPSTVETPFGSFTEATSEVSSFDFGGYGQIMAVGITENDRMVYSRIKDPSATPGFPLPPVEGSLLLPKRVASSYIADSWKLDENSMLKQDDDDSDALPSFMQNTHQGDALSLFEEYRGFIIKGAHVRTKPSEPDYFLEDKIDTAVSIAGIGRFANATSLKVRLLGSMDYLLMSRVINANHEGGVHNGNKYFVRMRLESGRKGTSEAVGGPGTPKFIDRIAIADDTRAGTWVSTIAHELGHTANLPHHGEGGFLRALWTSEPGSFNTMENAIDPASLGSGTVRVNPTSLFTQEAPTLDSGSQEMMIGGRCFENNTGGIYSGDVTCIMRSQAQAYIPSADGQRDIRRTVTEPDGTALCKSKDGTGFNAGGANSRYGDATEGRGECAQKVCVNDNHVHAGYAESACTLLRAVN